MKLQTTHSINYNLVFRIVFISILVCVCFVASSFMVLESSEFFERFYTGNSKNFGFISAYKDDYLDCCSNFLNLFSNSASLFATTVFLCHCVFLIAGVPANSEPAGTVFPTFIRALLG